MNVCVLDLFALSRLFCLPMHITVMSQPTLYRIQKNTYKQPKKGASQAAEARVMQIKVSSKKRRVYTAKARVEELQGYQHQDSGCRVFAGVVMQVCFCGDICRGRMLVVDVSRDVSAEMGRRRLCEGRPCRGMMSVVAQCQASQEGTIRSTRRPSPIGGMAR
jgi:hypothetical protein